MMYRRWRGMCLCAERETDFPPNSRYEPAPFRPLVFLVRRAPLTGRGMFAVKSLAEVCETESAQCLRPCRTLAPAQEAELAAFVEKNGATVLNLEFQNAFFYLLAHRHAKHAALRVTLVGLGDVGGTVLTGLALLGREIAEVRVYDPNEALCRRYALELNQVLPDTDGRRMPLVSICPTERLFDCDLFLFTASRGVPGLDSGVRDVRMAQFEANREMLSAYARMARRAGFTGVFCQISDPVDLLARCVFLQSNRDDAGRLDFAGLLPEQVQGFGLGVMAARAAYYARQAELDVSRVRVYGPHGEGLVVANAADGDYDEALSLRLSEQTRRANLAVRALGYKPYLAPGLSSAAISILRLVRGQTYHAAVPLDGAYFGCVGRMTRQGLAIEREDICPALMRRIAAAHRALREFDCE